MKNDKPPGWGYDAVHLPCVSRMVIHVASFRELKKTVEVSPRVAQTKTGQKTR
ncbi:MAG TPA: hypothetical protein VK872_05290 [Draconibacterium sp.]|nr:hypothetical protein [Draconibacterium sp.]